MGYVLIINGDRKRLARSDGLTSYDLFSGFCGARVAARPARTLRAAARAPVRVAAASGYQWLNKEPLALIVGFVG